jgi:hypothetical protein
MPAEIIDLAKYKKLKKALNNPDFEIDELQKCIKDFINEENEKEIATSSDIINN